MMNVICLLCLGKSTNPTASLDNLNNPFSDYYVYNNRVIIRHRAHLMLDLNYDITVIREMIKDEFAALQTQIEHYQEFNHFNNSTTFYDLEYQVNISCYSLIQELEFGKRWKAGLMLQTAAIRADYIITAFSAPIYIDFTTNIDLKIQNLSQDQLKDRYYFSKTNMGKYLFVVGRVEEELDDDEIFCRQYIGDFFEYTYYEIKEIRTLNGVRYILMNLDIMNLLGN